MILRFMGDLPEAEPKSPTDLGNIMQDLSLLLSKNAVRSADVTNSKPHRFVRKTLKRKSKLPRMLRQVCEGEKDETQFYQSAANANCNHLEKLHFIIGHGILRVSLRDEILAQICKQLCKNPSRNSYSRGWLLLSLCIGCFPPSATFENHMRSFLKNNSYLLAAQVEQRMERTIANGARSQPPSMLELQAIQSRTPIKLDIHLYNGEVKKLQVDSATTAGEVMQQLSNNLELIDSFGFGLIVTLYDKVMSLGAGREHILDAISSCEQLAKERGERELSAPWKFHMRKEMFSTWYDPSVDPLARKLIYQQVMDGLKCGEYRCRSEQDIAMLCALSLYIECGASLANIGDFVKKRLPQDLLARGADAVQTWGDLIAQTHQRSSYVQRLEAPERAMEDICLFAHLSWPMRFSRLFEVVRVSGPKLQSDKLVMALNATGIYLIDDMEQVLVNCTYAEVQQIDCHHLTESGFIDELSLQTVQQENFLFKCYEAQDVVDLVQFMLENLRKRSRFVVATETQMRAEDTNQLVLRPGELIELEPGIKGAQLMANEQSWWRGTTDNGDWGEFNASKVNILPTLVKPSQEVLEVYKERMQGKKEATIETIDIAQKRIHRQYNLSRLAETQFRAPTKDENSPLWNYSLDILKAPLLKALASKPDLFQQSLVIHHHTMKYMGDIPRGAMPVNTDLIFQPALQQSLLCDELYCHLMKQLTHNETIESSERGWDLLYLAVGLMAPSVVIMRELILFLKTSGHMLAFACLHRLKRTLLNGQRKHSPHTIEVEGIQQRCMHIYHKVYFPDDTVEAFEIASSTRGSHLIEQIAERLDLKCHLGFSIFLKISDKVYAMPETEFVFDFITELMQWLRVQQKSIRTSTEVHYQLHFMRKLWLNTMKPGADINADIIFNYPQEVHKYLKGFYAIDCELASQLAALIYIAEYGNSLVALQRLHENLITLVPEDLLAQQNLSEWRHIILSNLRIMEYENCGEMEAKQLFLLKLSEQSCFGSTFFAVKQLSDDSLPENVLIAINSIGFHILDSQTKLVLRSHEYQDLGIWSSGKNHFHIRFGNMIGASKLLCSTTQGYKMDDLLSSYIKCIQ